MLKINGVAIATPKVFEVAISDLDGETNRNAFGQMVRDRIAVKRKLNCEWPPLGNDEISKILKSVQEIFFTVTYPDPMEGVEQTKFFYVGDRTAPMYTYIDGVAMWSGLKMNLIEQ